MGGGRIGLDYGNSGEGIRGRLRQGLRRGEEGTRTFSSCRTTFLTTMEIRVLMKGDGLYVRGLGVGTEIWDSIGNGMDGEGDIIYNTNRGEG